MRLRKLVTKRWVHVYLGLVPGGGGGGCGTTGFIIGV